VSGVAEETRHRLGLSVSTCRPASVIFTPEIIRQSVMAITDELAK
jgi:hypothetical protein